jgi:hypothetical protein
VRVGFVRGGKTREAAGFVRGGKTREAARFGRGGKTREAARLIAYMLLSNRETYLTLLASKESAAPMVEHLPSQLRFRVQIFGESKSPAYTEAPARR